VSRSLPPHVIKVCVTIPYTCASQSLSSRHILHISYVGRQVCVMIDRNKSVCHVCLPPPHNQIYSRFWYAFSLFLRKFHSVNPLNGNCCELGRARFAEKKMEFPSQVVSKRYSILLSAKFGPFSNPSKGHASAVHDERAEWTCSRNVLCSKTWNPPRM